MNIHDIVFHGLALITYSCLISSVILLFLAIILRATGTIDSTVYQNLFISAPVLFGVGILLIFMVNPLRNLYKRIFVRSV